MHYHTASVHSPLQFVLLEPASKDTPSISIVQRRRDLLRCQLSTHEAVKAFLCSELQNVIEEMFALLLLDKRYRVLHFHKTPNSTLTIAYPRDVIQRALRYKASAVVLARGFPSDKPRCDRTEVKLVKTLKALLALADVHLLDHIGIARTGYMSLAERGQL